MKRSLLLTVLLAACGTKTTTHGGIPGSKPVTPPPAGDGATYTVDASNLLASDAMKSMLWTVVASVEGAEKARVTDKDFDTVAAALRGVTVKSGDTMAMTITVKNAAGKVLASNVAADAATEAGTKALWDKECAGKVTDSFSVREGLNAKFNDKDATVGIQLKLCDFDGILLKGAITLEPAQDGLKKHDVVFTCNARESSNSRNVSNSFYAINSLYDDECKVGYRKAADSAIFSPLKAADGSFRPIEVPANDSNAMVPFAEDKWSQFELAFDSHNDLSWSGLNFSDITGLPSFVRKNGACNSFEFVRHYLPDGAAPDQVKEARFIMEKTSRGGELAWRVHDREHLPFSRNVVDQHDGGAKITFYVHCTWYSEPTAAVSTIAIGN